jgi:hypothetical protein
MLRVWKAGLLTVVACLAMGGTALAASASWTANPGSSYSDGVVTLTNSGGAGTSYENPNLDVPVVNGDKLTFEYSSTDVTCGGGTPRVFIQGGLFNTFDQDPNNVTAEPACGVAIGDGWFRVTTTVTGIVDGTAGHTGIVNDNPADPGTVLVRNLTIAGQPVPLGNEEPSTGPTSKSECKHGSWRAGPYKNQGQCVSHFAKAQHGSDHGSRGDHGDHGDHGDVHADSGRRAHGARRK